MKNGIHSYIIKWNATHRIKKNQPHTAHEKNNAHPKSSEKTHCKQKAKARRKWKGNNLCVTQITKIYYCKLNQID